MEFKCSICEYKSPEKASVVRHTNKQNKCGENPTVIDIEGSIKCVHCGTVCKTQKLINKHYKTCKHIKKKDEKKTQSAKNINNITNNNTVNNVTNNININITIPLRPYTDPKLLEDMDDLFEECWIKMRCALTYIERVYCNIELPENHSMCITNLRAVLSAKVFTGERWETKNQDKFLDELISSVCSKMDRWMSLSSTKTKKEYKEAYDNFLEDKNEDKLYNEMREEIRLLLYNYSKTNQINIKSAIVTPYLIEDEGD